MLRWGLNRSLSVIRWSSSGRLFVPCSRSGGVKAVVYELGSCARLHVGSWVRRSKSRMTAGLCNCLNTVRQVLWYPVGVHKVHYEAQFMWDPIFAITRAAMQNLDSQIWKKRISISTKLKLYNTCILPSSCAVPSAGPLPRGMYTRLMFLINGVCVSCWESNGTTMCGMMMWDGKQSNRIFRLLFKRGIFPCSATLRECQTNQMPSRS